MNRNIKATYDGKHFSLTAEAGERLVQGVIVPVPSVQIQEVEELSETSRGVGGFGSTGK